MACSTSSRAHGRSRPARTASYCSGKYWLSKVSGGGFASSVREQALERRFDRRAPASSSGSDRSGCTADPTPAAGRSTNNICSRIAGSPPWRAAAVSRSREERSAPSHSRSMASKRPERLAHGERQPGPDLQDRKVLLHQRAQIGRASGSRWNALRKPCRAAPRPRAARSAARGAWKSITL